MSIHEAMNWIVSVLDLDENDLHELPVDEFKLSWHAVFFLYSGLHPDDAIDHGDEIIDTTEDHPDFIKIDSRLLKPYFAGSGWPVVLAPLAEEAWRRYNGGMLTDEDFYCSDAQYSGIVKT
ncbi:MAG: hypothetical protein P9X24_17285 [Candidatus Hatepunaea meridiana]|nr:hypothetical protein [Candidatus Hatepunaea meridiana]